jgi:hypothetical protein
MSAEDSVNHREDEDSIAKALQRTARLADVMDDPTVLRLRNETAFLLNQYANALMSHGIRPSTALTEMHSVVVLTWCKTIGLVEEMIDHSEDQEPEA